MTESNPDQSPQESSKADGVSSSEAKTPEHNSHASTVSQAEKFVVIYVLALIGGILALLLLITMVRWWMPGEFVLFAILLGAIIGGCLGGWLMSANPHDDANG